MYEQFYGLQERPFSLNPNPFYLYKSKKHQKALNLMEYGLVNQAAFCVITGEIGTGKTTLVRELLHQIDKHFTIGLLTSTHHSFGEILKLLLIAFDLDHRNKDKAELYQTLYDFLIEEYSHQRQVVLIIDEAQNMAPDALEELRMLSNINVDEHNVLQMILVGQEGLRDMLRRPELEQFAQRIAVDYHLEPLDRTETHTYILHRLEIAGGPRSRHVFNMEACDAVYQYTGGIPRLINMLCDVALVYGFAEQKHTLNAGLIDEVALDKKGGGILPLREITGPFDESESNRLISLHTPIEEKTDDDCNTAVNDNEVNSADGSDTDESNPAESISDHVFVSQSSGEISRQTHREDNQHTQSSSPQTKRWSLVFAQLLINFPKKNAYSYLKEVRKKSKTLFRKLHIYAYLLLNKGKVESLRLKQFLSEYTHVQSLYNSVRVKIFKQTTREANKHLKNVFGKCGYWYKPLISFFTGHGHKVIIAAAAFAIVGLLTFLGKTGFFHGRDAANVIAKDAEARTQALNTTNTSLNTDYKNMLSEPIDVISTPRLASVADEKQSQITEIHASAQDEDLVVVQAGSTLSTILVEELGRYDETLLDEVLRLNPKIRNPDVIAVGQRITLPKRHQLN